MNLFLHTIGPVKLAYIITMHYIRYMTQTTNAFAKTKPTLLDLVKSSSQETHATTPARELTSVDPGSAPSTTLRPDLIWNWEEFDRLMLEAGFKTRAILSTAAGMQRQQLYRIWLGQLAPTTRTIAKLCRVLDAQPGDFLSY